jgi:hypothetical protein
MPEPETYIFESDQRQRHSYEISTVALTYRPPGHKSITVRWEDIRYLDDIPGLKVDVVLNDAPTTIPLYYGTRNFGALLTAVCLNLAGLHREKIGTQTFKGSLAYFVHSGLVLGVFLVLVLGSVFYLYRFTPVWLFVLTITLPMALYILLQPHTVAPEDEMLVVKDFVRTRFIDYGRIERVVFDFHGDRQAAFLCILVHLVNGRKIKMQRFENLILLFIFIQTKWHNARGKASTNVPPVQSSNYPSG